MDNVDSGSSVSASTPGDPARTSAPSADADTQRGSEQGDGPRGADLARQALEAARANAATRRTSQRPRGSGTRRTGRRRGWSGARGDERDPQPLSKLVDRVAGQRQWKESLTGGTVFARWGELVGEDIATHATPVQLSGGELTVRAESTAWATQLRLLQRQLLARLAGKLGDGVVTKIKVAGPSAPSWRYGPRHVPGRGPRDTYG